MRGSFKHIEGFTLIEVLVALTIVSVGVMAIGSFSISTLGSGQTSRERLTALHLAEQFMEEWQQSDILPTLDSNYCKTAVTWTVSTLPSAPSICPATTPKPSKSDATSCVPLFGSKLSYNISAIESQVCGPSKNGGTTFVAFAGTSTPKTKYVEVSWTHRGDHKVTLTHVSKVP